MIRIETEQTVYLIEDRLLFLSSLAFIAGDYRQACDLLGQMYASVSAKGNKLHASALARVLGIWQLYAGDPTAAAQCFRVSLIDNIALGDGTAVAACLAAFAVLALAQGDLSRSAQLFGASDGVREAIHARMYPEDRIEFERREAEVRQRMDAGALEATWAQGMLQALEYADRLVGFILRQQQRAANAFEHLRRAGALDLAGLFVHIKIDLAESGWLEVIILKHLNSPSFC